jgi:hypothetical protein
MGDVIDQAILHFENVIGLGVRALGLLLRGEGAAEADCR